MENRKIKAKQQALPKTERLFWILDLLTEQQNISILTGFTKYKPAIGEYHEMSRSRYAVLETGSHL